MGEGLMDTDPWCVHVPDGAAVIEPLVEQPKKLVWSEEAEKRLARVPSFLRKMVRSRAESYVQELGLQMVTEEHLAALAAKRFGSNGPPRPSTRDEAAQQANGALPWSEQAKERLASIPAFLQEGVRAIAEDVARSEGRLEVNVKLLDRLEAEQQPDGHGKNTIPKNEARHARLPLPNPLGETTSHSTRLQTTAAKSLVIPQAGEGANESLREPHVNRSFPWADEADRLLAEFLAEKKPQVRMFIAPALENAAEQFAKKRCASTVELDDAEQAIAQLTGGVAWEEDALARVLSAPDFIRAGIKKAAEFNARKEGLERITSADLTRFRNNAMMRAVQRMKGFGMQELSFDAYEIARDRVPRLKENPEADKRFDTIKSFVAARENPGDLLGQDLLEKMKAQLKAGKQDLNEPK
jgi:hypothetical protein